MLNAQIKIEKKLNNGLVIPPIMLGSFQVNNFQMMLDMVEVSVENGCFGFDTSPSYNTEEILGNAIREICRQKGFQRDNFFISDKIDGWQMYTGNGEVEKYVDQSLKLMGIDYFDLLLVHWPFEKYLLNTWKCFERIYNKGKVKSIGLCNVNIRVLNNLLNQDINIKPHIIQNEISPLRTCEEEIRYFRENQIMVEAYSPLCRMIKPIKESNELGEIAESYSKSIPQVILRWHVEREIIPIFTSTKPERIRSNLDIFDFSLTHREINLINSLNRDYKIFPESYGCPGY